MRSCTLLLCVLFVLSCVLSCVKSDTIYFNSTSPCSFQGSCLFSDSSTWEGGVVPGSNDTVIIGGSQSVTIILDATTPQGAHVSLTNIQLYNATSLVVEQISFNVALYIRLYDLATLSIINSNATLWYIRGGKVWVKGSTVNCYEVEVYNLTLAGSSFTSYNFAYSNAPTLNISDSSIATQHPTSLTLDSLYATGNVTFANTISLDNNATFIGVPNLQLRGLYLYGSVQIIDCASSITSLFFYEYSPSTLTYSNSLPTSHYLGNLVTYGNLDLTVGDNVNLTLLGNSKPVYLSMGDNSNLTVLSSAYLTSSGEMSDSSSMYAMGSVYLEDGEFPVNIYVAASGKVQTSNDITFSTSNGNCNIHGPGILTVSGTTECKGTLTIGSVYGLGGVLEVETLNTATLSGYMNIEGDVEITGTLVINFGLGIEISGEYTQNEGSINVTYGGSTNPYLQVEGKMSISSVTVNLLLGSFYFDKDEAKLAFAKCEHFSHHSTSLVDASDAKRKFVFTTEEEIVYIERAPKNYFIRNWQWLLVVVSLGVICSLILICMFKKESSFSTLEKNEPHEVISNYFKSMKASNVNACTWAWVFPLFIIFLPFFAEAAACILVLAVFIPLGFLMGLIEHKFVFLWAVVVLFIQLGGLLDLFADISLVAKFFIFYFDMTFGINNPNDHDIAEAETLTLIRLALTLGGSFVCLVFLFMLSEGFGRFLDTLTGKKFWKDEKDKSSKSFGSGPAVVLIMLLLIMMWKIVLMAFRVYMLYTVAKSLITKRRLEQHIQNKIQWIEIILFFDLVWSGIPLGVLTGLELFVYDKEFELTGETVFELLKMGALAVDLVGFSFLVYYIVFGLIHKVPCLHHKHEYHHLQHDENDENGGHGGHGEGSEHSETAGEAHSHTTVSVHTEHTPLIPNEKANNKKKKVVSPK